jgi:CheY-like chemotaxis protein
LRIEVWDSGPGIPAEQRELIFDEFVRLQPSDTGRQRGLGLGLAIVQRLCGLLGHRVTVESIVGKGSRFSVIVPVGTTSEAVPGPHRITVLAAGPSPSFEGQRVAVIDDDPRVLESIGGLLRSWGCLAMTAASTTEALALLARDGQPPTLIIADYNLSEGANGVDAIRAVRARFGVEIPAFLISAEATSARIAELRATGLQVLRKPTSPVMLRALMLSELGTGAQTALESTAAEPKA